MKIVSRKGPDYNPFQTFLNQACLPEIMLHSQWHCYSFFNKFAKCCRLQVELVMKKKT